MTDRLTKALLAAIALGLWANAVIPLARPTLATAAKVEDLDLSGLEWQLGEIDAAIANLKYPMQDMGDSAVQVARLLRAVHDGKCPNVRLCSAPPPTKEAK